MDLKSWIYGQLKSYRGIPIEDDRSTGYLDNFVEWTKELKRDIALFGYCKAAEILLEKYPDSYNVIVDLDPAKHGKKVGKAKIIGFDEYKKERTGNLNIIITDIRLQYVYLDLIYDEILYPAGLVTVEGLWDNKVRYNYALKGIAYGNNPEVFDYEFLRIKKELPMECTIPSDSLIRLMDCVRTSAEVEGDILEIGTGEGGSTYFMASVLESLDSDKIIYSVDAFEASDYIPNLTFEVVSDNLKRFTSIVLIKGYAPQVLYQSQIGKVAFAFADLYAFPDILEYVYPRVSAGGMILIDNYNHGCYHNHGMPIANQFFRDKKEKIVRVGGTQGLVVKQ